MLGLIVLFLEIKLPDRKDTDDEDHTHNDHQIAHEIHEIVIALIVQCYKTGQYFKQARKDQDASGTESDAEHSRYNIQTGNDIDRKTQQIGFEIR